MKEGLEYDELREHFGILKLEDITPDQHSALLKAVSAQEPIDVEQHLEGEGRPDQGHWAIRRWLGPVPGKAKRKRESGEIPLPVELKESKYYEEHGAFRIELRVWYVLPTVRAVFISGPCSWDLDTFSYHNIYVSSMSRLEKILQAIGLNSPEVDKFE